MPSSACATSMCAWTASGFTARMLLNSVRAHSYWWLHKQLWARTLCNSRLDGSFWMRYLQILDSPWHIDEVRSSSSQEESCCECLPAFPLPPISNAGIADEKCPCLNSARPRLNSNVRLIRFYGQRLAIFGRSRLKFSLLREYDTQVSMDHGVLRILLFQLSPQQFSIVEFARSH